MIKKFLFTIFLGLSAFANSLTVGSELPALTVKDQFDKEFTIDAKVKTVIFSATKEESNVIKEFLATKDKDYLTNNNIAYVADITGMPSLISKFIAIPKMKDYAFSILLIDEDNKALFPVEEDKISIITLENSKVTNIKFIKTTEELAATFK
jgi:predicted transcriptional regulator